MISVFNKSRRSLVKALPFLRSAKSKYICWQTARAWQKAVSALTPSPTKKELASLLIVPSDPYSIVGSRGDEAMTEALIAKAKEKNNDIQIFFMVATNEARDEVLKRGCIPIQINNLSPHPLLHKLRKISPSAVAVIGADVMDGYYSPETALHMLMIADLASRLGSRVFFSGFSFNKTPAQQLIPAFDQIHPHVRIAIRDPISLSRFCSRCSAAASLVADAAFCLKPKSNGSSQQILKNWMRERRAEGSLVFAVNINNFLIKNASKAQISAMLEKAAETLSNCSKQQKISWVLLPHDYRGEMSDDYCLALLEQQLIKNGTTNCLYISQPHSAAELKALVGEVDSTITGRMHLAIASLGMKVPTIALTYQDKFHGLYQHFGLPEWLLLDPQSMFDDNLLEKTILRFAKELPHLKKIIEDKLPEVEALSRRNFDLL